jgi:hypothetical protein
MGGRPGNREGRTLRDARPDLGRRRFWRDMVGAVMGLGDDVRGIPRQSMRDVGNLPDHILAEMVPAWMEARPVEVRQDGLYRPATRKAPARCVHPFAENDLIMVDQYACGRNLRAIAAHLASVAEITPDQAFAATRDLFIRLCKGGWCHPAAAHIQPPTEGEQT